MGTIFGTTYYSLGGFDELQVFSFEGAERTVIGRHFVGREPSEEIEQIVLETKEMVENGRLKGQFTMVIYQDETLGEDSVHYFIGASFDEIRNILELPSGFTYEEFKTNKIYRVFITQHPLVRPFPDEVQSMIEVRSIEDGEVLSPYTFDIYYEDGSLRTEGWVFKN